MIRKLQSQKAISLVISLFVVLAALLAGTALGGFGGSRAYAQTTSKIDGKTYTHLSRYQDDDRYKVFDGIDVSYWQYTNNWKKIKNDGVDFAIIRCGYTGTGSTFSMKEDSTFERNLVNAVNNGVNVGVYYYSLARTQSEAQKEANFVVSLLHKYEEKYGIRVNLPVVMDYEYTGSDRCGTYFARYSKSSARTRATNNAVKWLDTVADAGYTPMFYSYRGMIDSSFSAGYKFNMSKLNGSDQYPFWLAQYSTSNSYTGNTAMWQYTSSGSVNGTGSSKTDRNFMYYDVNGRGTADGTKNIRSCSIQLAYQQMKYDGDPKEPAVVVKDGTKTLEKNKDYTVAYFKNRKKGTAYAVIQGIGAYSNDIMKTFTIGTKNDANTSAGNKNVPAVPASLKASVKTSENAVSLSWKPSDDATDYTVSWKLNGSDDWKTVSTSQTQYDLELDPGDLADVRVRAENRSSGTAVSSGWTSTLHRYVGKTSLSSTMYVKDRKLALNLSKETLNTNAAKASWQVQVSTDGGSYQSHYADSSSDNVPVEEGKRYAVKARPAVLLGSTRYTGAYSRLNRRYAVQNTITSISGADGSATLTFDKTDGGTGSQVQYAADAGMSGAKVQNVSGSEDTAKITGLSASKTYYFRVRTNKKVGKSTFIGAYSGKKSVKPVQMTPAKLKKISVSVSEVKKTVQVKFGSVKLADNYQVAYQRNDETKWTSKKTGGSTELTFTLPEAGDTVRVRVRALHTAGGKTYDAPWSSISYNWLKRLKLTEVTAQKAAFRATPEDGGQTQWKLYYAPTESLKGKKTALADGADALTVKNLAPGAAYWMKGRGILKKDGHNYYGQYSAKQSVTVK